MSTPSLDLDRTSPVPLYFQLAQAIERAIADGTIPPGSRLENEIALGHRLNLSRPTTRRALQELVDKGLLVRKRGVGTQVVQSSVHRPVALTSLFDDLVRAGERPSTEVLSYRLASATPEIAELLSLRPGEQVLTLRRLRSASDEPLAVMRNHVPAALAPTEAELTEHGLYHYLRSRGINLRVARQRIGARLATTEEAALLHEKPRAALLTVERTAFDDSGAVVEHGMHAYRASRYTFETTLVDR